MADWVVVPCLLQLRNEFNALSPNRDKGADGTIGDSNHTSTSDHTPDEESDALRNKDSDTKNEVHALDIDSTGPWPGTTFDAKVKEVIAGEKKKWLSSTDKCRLNYVIWNRFIYDKDNDFNPVPYTGSNPHTDHGHFSARYETSCENDTRPFMEDDFVDKNTFFEWLDDYYERILKQGTTAPYNGYNTTPVARAVTDFQDMPFPLSTDPNKKKASLWQILEAVQKNLIIKDNTDEDILEQLTILHGLLTEIINLIQAHSSGIIEGTNK